jgi:NADH-quinone oxidoreductase subunit E
MSMFSFPADMNMNEMMKPMSAMTNWTKVEEMPVSPLMVYPLGAAAAATAIGIGMAGQMAGMMTGAMQAAMRSQGATLGSKPDLSWMFPVFAEDLAPEETDAAPVVAKAKSADIVELKPSAKAAKVASGEKPAAKATKAKATPAKSKPKAPVKAKSMPSDEGAVAVVEKLKSDAKIAAAAASETVPAAKAAAPALEPEDFRRPAEIEKPDSPDDLKLISGVGPKLEQVLNGLGIWTFAQIADWKAEEIAWVDDYLQFKGRIDRDDWISQAR